jgi:hypothetical protein
MAPDKAKRDQSIEELRREMAEVERRIKLDEAVPAERRREIAGASLNDALLSELSAYCRRDCERYARLRAQLRRLSV